MSVRVWFGFMSGNTAGCAHDDRQYDVDWAMNTQIAAQFSLPDWAFVVLVLVVFVAGMMVERRRR